MYKLNYKNTHTQTSQKAVFAIANKNCDQISKGMAQSVTLRRYKISAFLCSTITFKRHFFLKK